MHKIKPGLGLNRSFGAEPIDQIKLFYDVGFESFFSGWGEEINVAEYRRRADECGIIYQSIHAPFDGAAKMWATHDIAEGDIKTLIACARDCAEYGVPIMVMHAYIGKMVLKYRNCK